MNRTSLSLPFCASLLRIWNSWAGPECHNLPGTPRATSTEAFAMGKPLTRDLFVKTGPHSFVKGLPDGPRKGLQGHLEFEPP